jgi:hypothetical protein
VKEPSAFYGASPLAKVGAGFVLFVRGEGKHTGADVAVEHCELMVPGAAPLVTPTANCTMKDVSVKLDRARGGELKVRLEGEISTAAKSYKVVFFATTFVRDVVKSAGALLAKDGGATH